MDIYVDVAPSLWHECPSSFSTASSPFLYHPYTSPGLNGRWECALYLSSAIEIVVSAIIGGVDVRGNCSDRSWPRLPRTLGCGCMYSNRVRLGSVLSDNYCNSRYINAGAKGRLQNKWTNCFCVRSIQYQGLGLILDWVMVHACAYGLHPSSDLYTCIIYTPSISYHMYTTCCWLWRSMSEQMSYWMEVPLLIIL